MLSTFDRPAALARRAPRPISFAAFAALLLAAGSAAWSENWPQWRGPRNDGVSAETGLPTTWSRSENVIWRTPLPGPAGSTPIIWDDRIFLTSAQDKDLLLLCLSTDGKVRWQRKVTTGSETVRGDEGNYASPSPSTDGKHVWTLMGNGILACYDFEGSEVWRRDLQEDYGPFRVQFGLASTPVLDEGRLYLQLLNSNYATVLALDAATGKQIWKQSRPSDAIGECEQSYASPMLYRSGKEAFLLTHGCDYIVAHRLSDGAEIWRCGGMNPKGKYNPTLRFVASPVAVPGLIVVPSAKNGPVLALRPSGSGDITETRSAHAWTRSENTPDVPSPLVHDGLVYLCRETGILICVDASTGEEIYQHRCHSQRHRASPVYADGKIYLTARDGVVTVVKAGRDFKILASNDLGESISASPAISGGRIYLRTFDALYAIGKQKPVALADERPAAHRDIPLFNGRDLSGWTVEGTKDFDDAGKTRPVWSVESGEIICDGHGYGFLRYERSLTDFRFATEYRMRAGMKKPCNSGIGIRGVAYTGMKETRPSFASYEIQLLDDSNSEASDHSSGSLYRYVAPTKNPVKPAGEWNRIEIECVGPRIRVSINGTRVQDVDQSKVPALRDKPLAGFLSLQNHGGYVEFRDLKLQTLDTPTNATAANR